MGLPCYTNHVVPKTGQEQNRGGVKKGDKTGRIRMASRPTLLVHYVGSRLVFGSFIIVHLKLPLHPERERR